MGFVMRRLALGFGLIALASAVLLLADLKSREGARGRRVRVAVLQVSRNPVLDTAIDGIGEALAARGFIAGQTLELRRFDAGGDAATAGAIATQIAGGGYDLAVTVGTAALQTLTAANREGRVRQVFGVVSDPVAAGVAERGDLGKHPAHLTGYSSLQPVEAGFRLARALNPALGRVGVAWNPAEPNSEATVKLARAVCRDLKIELVEAPVDATAAVGEAAASLVARGVEALWIGGDSTVIGAQRLLISEGRKGHIPTFTSNVGGVKEGALFDLGADYHEVGRITGELAADVLGGRDPAGIPIRNVMPERLRLNEEALAGLSGSWTIPAEVKARAAAEAAPAPRAAGGPARHWRVAILEFNSMVETEESEKGIRDGLREAGLVEGKDLTIDVLNAQGDMATLPALVSAAVSKGADLLMPLSTPTLQATLPRAEGRPTVFMLVANPIVAGAGRSYEDHAPHVTGVATASAYRELVQLVRELLPQAKRLGTLYVPSEVNSVYNRDQVAKEAKALGLELESIAVAGSSEVTDAALALASRDLDAICQVASNLTTTSFGAIAQAGARRRLPTFGFLGSNAKEGAVAVLSRDYYDGGKQAAALAVRVMRGESPARIPIQPLATTRLLLNEQAAAAVGLDIPPAVRARAQLQPAAGKR